MLNTLVPIITFRQIKNSGVFLPYKITTEINTQMWKWTNLH